MPRKTIDELLKLGQERKYIEVTDNKIKYLIQQKEYEKDPEEIIRASTYVELIEDYNYSPYRIEPEVLIPSREPFNYADLVIYQDDDHKTNYIVIENKPIDINDRDFSQAIEQGFGYANSLRARYLIVDSYSKRNVYDIEGFPPNEREKNRISDIPINYGLVPSYKFIREQFNDLNIVSFDELSKIFQKCHNIIWSGGKEDPATSFDEMSKILFAKIWDERNTPNNASYKFQVGRNENEVIVAIRIKELYEKSKEVDPSVFSEPILLSDSKIKEVVNVIQHISLSNTDLDAKGQAFEKFLGVVFRGELGQFFTRRQIVEFVVNMLEPNEDDFILDPSCGSGGFLLYAMESVAKKIRKLYSGNNSLIINKLINFNLHNLFGIEINSKISRVAMMDMIVNDDGHTNIENNTGLNSTFKNSNIHKNKFTLIMTNPPFGVQISRDDHEQLGKSSFNDFIFGGSKKSQLSDILFLEQYHKFLSNDSSKNPRLGVVLQTGVLNNPSNKSVLDWIKLNFKVLAVVSLPDFAFRKAGSGMKTCLLFLKKYDQPYESIIDVKNYKLLFAIANHIGYDSTLRPDVNELPEILKYYFNNIDNKNNDVFWLNYLDLDYRLDPMYYKLRFEVVEQINKLQDNGISVLPLSKLIKNFNAGKSPEGGVTRSSGEIPSITITNITRDGNLNFSETLNFVPDIFYEDFNNSKGELLLGDILIAKDGATTGKTAMIDEKFPFNEKDREKVVPKAVFSEHIFRITLREGISPTYINAFLNSKFGQMQMEMITTGGAQGGITQEFIHQIFVPLLNKQDQDRITKIWESGIFESEQLLKKYYENNNNTKKLVDKALEKSIPLTNKELKELIGE